MRRGRISPEQAAAFRDRWQAVNAAERAELRAMPMEQKLRQLAALMASARGFPTLHAVWEDEAAARERWLRLKLAHGA